MEDALLDMSQDELTVKETQLRDSPATFSRNLVDRFKIIGHNNQTGSETVNPIDNSTICLCKYNKVMCGHDEVTKVILSK